ncbi:hypothetical protein, partial [Klebsiella pneumoniae]|uniref:hypothetical protein n=1 Tax=Klebsiella pneumoniae TaxID=573 RepID=UPI0019D6E3DB
VLPGTPRSLHHGLFVILKHVYGTYLSLFVVYCSAAASVTGLTNYESEYEYQSYYHIHNYYSFHNTLQCSQLRSVFMWQSENVIYKYREIITKSSMALGFKFQVPHRAEWF